jgi:hypothetical protein
VALPAIRGLENPGTGAFRTYSCKKNLPPATSIHSITCRALFDSGIYVGKVELDVQW